MKQTPNDLEKQGQATFNSFEDETMKKKEKDVGELFLAFNSFEDETNDYRNIIKYTYSAFNSFEDET